MKHPLTVVAALFIPFVPTFAQVKSTENTLKLEEDSRARKRR